VGSRASPAGTVNEVNFERHRTTWRRRAGGEFMRYRLNTNQECVAV
jgi:hypothetical protein